ncbi:MAG: hypothetical protein DWQ44_02300 [Bacteroidetes bacterium]|nr:MAG: hypothetical protein DWQ33_06030 [Bacteroidota bacterium]REK04804.1 MAG: hypothetical protein DWQ39_06195 [Bacteroidota bacterium]REK36277.1 MAG: hypothetical protein DWQ44_02300 [Bacteroidota bacterium]REK51059.1 MAG: hypothetical protein DWQ48_02925 [Bacteroidota bacterium]
MNTAILFVFGFLILIEPISGSEKLYEIRRLYFSQNSSTENFEKLQQVIKATKDLNDPIITAYRGATMMISASHAMNPISKWRLFVSGRDSLEKAVVMDNKNTEIRFLRFSIQSNAPLFLGYNGNIQEDKKAIISGISSIGDFYTRSRIAEYMKRSVYCNEEDKRRLNDE